MSILFRVWHDENGFVVSSELILLATIVVVGLISGMTTVRDQVLQELGDVADAVSEVNQSYSYSGITSHAGSVSGSMFLDLADFGEVPFGGPSDDQFGGGAACTQGIDPAVAGEAE